MTERDPALDPRPLDSWETSEGRIRVIGSILTFDDGGKFRGPMVVFDNAAGRRCAYLPGVWKKFIAGARLVYTPEEFLRQNGRDVPPYPGLPST